MTDDTYIKLGWLGFILSALFFIFDSWRSGNMIGLTASIFFLLANIAFIIPIRGRGINWNCRLQIHRRAKGY